MNQTLKFFCFFLHLCFYVHCTSQNLCIIMYTVGDFLHCLNLLCWCVNPCNVQDFCYLTSDSTALALKCLHLLAVFRTGWLKTAPMFASSAFTMTLLSPPGLQTTASARTSRWCVCVCVSVCLLWVEGGGGLQKIMMPTEAPEKQPNETHHKRQISQPVYAPSHIYFQRSRAESGSATWKPFMASFALQKPCCFMLYLFKQSCFRRKSKSAG